MSKGNMSFIIARYTNLQRDKHNPKLTLILVFGDLFTAPSKITLLPFVMQVLYALTG